MTLIAVSGACSRSGKTALAVSLLRGLRPGAAAVKFTVTEDVFERCPRGTPCVVCDLPVPFRLVTDAATLGQPGTDTARLGETGASPVVWAIARESAVGPAWAAVRRRLDGCPVAVLEGSRVVAVARPDLRLFVVHAFLSPARWKPTSPALIAEADAVVVNLPSAEARPPAPEVLAELERHRGGRGWLVADVTAPVAAWALELLRGAKGEAARA